MDPLLHVGMVMAMSATTPEIETLLRAAEERLFLAIRTKDIASLGQELADDFVHSAPGSPDQPRDAFLAAIRDMPYDIRELKGEDLRVRLLGDVALVSGIQRARVALATARSSRPAPPSWTSSRRAAAVGACATR